MDLTMLKVLYINLESREDRKVSIENELRVIGLPNYSRFNAIKLPNGALGCSMSHLKCIQLAKDQKWPHVLILEDDIQFLNPELFKTQLNQFLSSDINWDVVLFAGNNMMPFTPINNCCIKIQHCLTTTGYLVKSHYYDTLIANYKKGIQLFLKNPSEIKYTIDRYWINLQEKDNWFLIIPLSVVQKEDYSNIENKITNFQKYMLNYNKAYKTS